MAFPQEPTRTPTAIADVSVELFDPDPTGDESARALYSVQIRFDDGSVEVRTGNLVPHLTQTQIDQLLAFMADMRQKATDGFLP